MRRTKALLVAVLAVFALVVSADPALASRSTGTTNRGGYCTADGFAIPTTTLGLLKRVDYGSHANCITATLPAHIIIQSIIYDGNSVVGQTSIAECYDCYEVSVISSYSGLALKTYRVYSSLTIDLYPPDGEVFLTPIAGCGVFNGGYSMWCQETDYA